MCLVLSVHQAPLDLGRVMAIELGGVSEDDKHHLSQVDITSPSGTVFDHWHVPQLTADTNSTLPYESASCVHLRCSEVDYLDLSGDECALQLRRRVTELREHHRTLVQELNFV